MLTVDNATRMRIVEVTIHGRTCDHEVQAWHTSGLGLVPSCTRWPLQLCKIDTGVLVCISKMSSYECKAVAMGAADTPNKQKIRQTQVMASRRQVAQAWVG